MTPVNVPIDSSSGVPIPPYGLPPPLPTGYYYGPPPPVGTMPAPNMRAQTGMPAPTMPASTGQSP